MDLFTEFVNTLDIPYTYDYLKLNFPSVLNTKCFNYNKFPFDIEVKNTEIGHLFEHILIEKLCINKINLGYKEVTFSGRTSWNWEKDKRGVFHIKINVTASDKYILGNALNESIKLTEELLTFKLKQPQNNINKFTSTDSSILLLPVD